MYKGDCIPIPVRHVTTLGNSMARGLIVNNSDSQSRVQIKRFILDPAQRSICNPLTY